MTALAPHRPFVHAAGDEPLPGYRLVSPLGRGGFGEVWKCVAPGGLPKAVKFVADDGPDAAGSLAQEYEAFQRVKGIRHPFLLTLERVELVGGELVMVMELADKSLAQRFDECRAAGRPGIPRAELLSYMVDAAEALDVLGREHGLQHLDVKPANLFLLGGHAKVGDYGLVARHLPGPADGEPRLGRGLTPRYVAPEILDGRVDHRSDQYPLALAYFELLTGAFPYPGPTVEHLLTQHRTAEPNVSALPAADRATVARGLAKNPADRFPTCLEFVRELLHEPTEYVTTPAPARHTTPVTIAAVTRLVTPADRTADLGPASIPADAVTQRILPPTKHSGTVANLTRAPDDLARACPGFHPAGELDHGPRGRTGKATDPAGKPVRVCVLRLDGGSAADLEHVVRLTAIPHPLLWQAVSAPHPRCVGFVTPDALVPLRDWARQRNESSRPLRPIDVADLLSPVAAALDDLHRRCRFPHLLISPHTLHVDADRCGITGFGVAELLRCSRPDADWLADDPYVAPEAAAKPGPASDQFSLALVYLKLVGAWTAPKKGHGERAGVHWAAVSAAEQAAARKALAPNPADRFATCAEFLAAVRPAAPSGVVLPEVRLVEPVAHLTGGPAVSAPPPAPAAVVEAVMKAAKAAGGAPDSGGTPFTLPDGRLAVRFPLKWTPGLGELKAAAFKDQCGYMALPMASDTTLLKPKSGKAPPVELVVRWPVLATAGMAEVVVTGRYTVGREPARGADQVAAVLEQFRRAVQNTADRRRSPRVRSEFAVVVYAVTDDLQVRGPIFGKCRDVSATGFAAVLPSEPASGHVFVSFPDVPDAAKHAVLAKLVRTRPEAGGEVLLACRYVHAGDGK